jgi:hypothetical protein
MGREKFLIEIIRIDKTQHNHTFKRTNNLFNKVIQKNEQGQEITIDVEPKDLYKVPPNHIINFFIWIITGRTDHYVMIVNSKGEPIEEITPSVSGKVLKVARDWKGLGKAVNHAFGRRFDLSGNTMIIALGLAIIVLAFLVYRGYIPIPEGLLNR